MNVYITFCLWVCFTFCIKYSRTPSFSSEVLSHYHTGSVSSVLHSTWPALKLCDDVSMPEGYSNLWTSRYSVVTAGCYLHGRDTSKAIYLSHVWWHKEIQGWGFSWMISYSYGKPLHLSTIYSTDSLQYYRYVYEHHWSEPLLQKLIMVYLPGRTRSIIAL